MSKTKSKQNIIQIMEAHLYLPPLLHLIIDGFLVQMARPGRGESATLVAVGNTFCDANTGQLARKRSCPD